MAFDPMNASPHHPKVKVSLGLPLHAVVAGQEVRGKILLECKADKGLGLSTIAVNLVAIQELTSRDHVATSTFLKTRRVFQGHGLPISNAVLAQPLPDSPPLPREYHPARKGQTTFFFAFPLPHSSPASVNFGNGVAKVKYEVTAHVEVVWKGEKRIVTDRQLVEVVECPATELRELPPVSIVSDGGNIQIQGRVVGGFVVSGYRGCLELLVKNHSKRKTNGVTVALCRKLLLAEPPKQSNHFTISDTLNSTPFHGPEYCVMPGVEGVANLVFDVPGHATGVRSGKRRSGEEEGYRLSESLFSVECELIVTLGMGLGMKDITFPIPLAIVHPSALPEHDSHPQHVAHIDGHYDDTVPYYPHYQEPMHALEPPRPHFTHEQYAHPPSPQFVPYAPSPVHSPPINYVAPQPHPHGIFPASSSQPGTPRPLPQAPITSGLAPFVQENLWHGVPLTHGIQHWVPEPLHAPITVDKDLAVWFPPPPNTTSPPPPPVALARTLSTRDGFGHSTPTRHDVHDAGTGDPWPVVTGKGQRALRVSHHLRLSSRNRSASPTSHRYPIPPPPVPQASHQQDTQSMERIEPLPPALNSPKAPPIVEVIQSPPHGNISLDPPDADLQMPTALVQPLGLISPRPLLSPQLSQQNDSESNGVKVASLRSQRVEKLEELAEAVLKEEAEAKAAGAIITAPETAMVMDKTLPSPPVPSGKPVKSSWTPLPRAGEIFTLPEPSGADHATRKPSGLSDAPASGGSGLDALERRLINQLSQSPDNVSRSREAPLSPKSQPARRSSNQAKDERASLSPTKRPKEKSAERGLPAMPTSQSDTKKPTISGSHDEPARRGRARPTVKSAAPVEPPQEDDEWLEREKEFHRLRKEAKGRIATWLEEAQSSKPEPDLEPWATLSGHKLVTQSTGFIDTKKLPKATGQPALMDLFANPTKEPVTETPGPITQPTQPNHDRPAVTPPPGPRSPAKAPAPRSPSPEARPKQAPRLAALLSPSDASPDGPKYDVRSARGGRGGRVTAVAALWADRTIEPSKSPPLAPAVKANPLNKVPASISNPNIRSGPTPKHDPAELPKVKPSKPNSFPFSVSLPAINDTLARPILSSAASIARPRPVPKQPSAPGQRQFEMPKLLPIDELPAKPVVPPMSGVGQARLKDLIAKYQQSTRT